MYILLAFLVFGVLIFTHELGHFLAAKLFGVRVNEFSINMGPTLWQKKAGETTYSLRLLPIGGFCAMEGEDEISADPRAFTSAKPWKRAIILIAGAAMNFITGFLVLVIMYATVVGFRTTQIVDFYPDCPMYREDGLQVNDEIYEIDGRRVYIYSDISMLLDRSNTGIYDLTVLRDGKLVHLDDFEMTQTARDQNGTTVYRYGIYFGYQDNSVGLTLRNAWYTSVDFARIVWMSLADLVKGFVSVKDMSGPVGIVSVIAETGKESETAADAALNIAYLGAFIAINLAVMNMLPIPALDGGRVFFLVVNGLLQLVLRRKIDPKYEGYIHAAGLILMLIFIALISLKDIWKLIAPF